MTVFIDSVRGLSRVFGIVAAVLLLAAALVVCQLVFVRYVLNESAIWQHEFVTFSLIASTFLGSPYLLLTRGHVNVDLLPIYLGGSARFALALLAAAVSLTFCLVLLWSSTIWWHDAWAGNWHAETVWAPVLWIPYAALPIGLGLLSLQYVADILALVSGRDAPFGLPSSGPP